MILFEFKPTGIELTVNALGGAIRISLKYDKYPLLRELPADQLEELGLALSVAVATADAQQSQVALQAAADYAKHIRSAGLIVPPQELVVP